VGHHPQLRSSRGKPNWVFDCANVYGGRRVIVSFAEEDLPRRLRTSKSRGGWARQNVSHKGGISAILVPHAAPPAGRSSCLTGIL